MNDKKLYKLFGKDLKTKSKTSGKDGKNSIYYSLSHSHLKRKSFTGDKVIHKFIK